MEEQEVVLTNKEFEYLLARNQYELDATGTVLTETRGDIRYTYIRRRDWEKKQEPFGVKATAARERIEKARRLRHHWPDNELMLLAPEYALLRNVNDIEMQDYVEAEELMTSLRLEQRKLILAVGERSNAWENEADRTNFFDSFDCSTMYEVHSDLPNGAVLNAEEESLFQGLGRRITAANLMQYNIADIASARYVDSHPGDYPNG